MWFYRRILKLSSIYRNTNYEVLGRISHKRELLTTSKMRKTLHRAFPTQWLTPASTNHNAGMDREGERYWQEEKIVAPKNKDMDKSQLRELFHVAKDRDEFWNVVDNLKMWRRHDKKNKKNYYNLICFIWSVITDRCGYLYLQIDFALLKQIIIILCPVIFIHYSTKK